MKEVYFCPPIQLSANQVIKPGVYKRKWRGRTLKRLLGWILRIFTIVEAEGQTEVELYNLYLEPDEKGQLRIAKSPAYDEKREKLITQVALVIHQTIPNKL